MGPLNRYTKKLSSSKELLGIAVWVKDGNNKKSKKKRFRPDLNR